MAAVADLERLIERVFERTTARLFRARVQVVQLEHRIERAMERSRTQEDGRLTVPARYRVRLHPTDLADVSERGGGLDALAVSLADAALAFARAHGYHLGGRPIAWLVADAALERGQVEVDVQVRAPGDGWIHALPEPQLAPPAPRSGHATVEPPAVAPPPEASAGSPADLPVGDSGSGIRGEGTDTRVYRRPVPDTARALLRITGPRATERTVEVDGTPLAIGRARDNGLVLDDARISRHHGRLQARRGTLVYADLGSTNGSRVNGIRVDEIVLGIGDRIQVGDTVLVVEMLPG